MRLARNGLPRFGPYWLRAVGVAAVLFATVAAAQMRTLPEEPERGHIRHVREMLVALDGREMLPSPAATIRDRLNLIIVPTALPAEGAIAEYLLGADGRVQRVWLLTPEEAAAEKKKKLPAAR